ncbi:hypothetical protein RQP46_007753 [Phenoliferia psychrophenolica]
MDTLISFAGAPVSKGLILGVGLLTVLAAASSRAYLFDVPLSPHLSRDHQLWRLAAHHFAFANSSELFLATVLLFNTSIPVERTFGSRKYGSFLVVVLGLATLMETLALLLGSRFGFTKIPAGPFAVSFAILYQYTRLVPSSFHWKVFGIEITSNLGQYFIASQLISSQPPSTIIVSLIGAFSSYLYRSDFLSLRQYRLSPRLTLLFVRFFSPLLGVTSTPRRSNVATYGHVEPRATNSLGFPSATFGATRVAPVPAAAAATTGVTMNPGTAAAQRRAQGQAIVQQLTTSFAGAQRSPTEEQITHLTAMFPDRSREVVIAALQSARCGGSVG